MIHIAILLHIYQPPCQSYSVLKDIIKESYLPFLKVIKNSKNAKITLNINGSLTELLNLYGYEDVISIINELSLEDKVRFTGSGMYHPILPLLPIDELKRQIDLNEIYNGKMYNSYSNKKGFYPPEMCISLNTLDLVNNEGYDWIIADGIASPNEWPTNKYYRYKNMAVLFRDSIISNHIAFNEISPQNLIEKLKTLFNQDYYLIFALDGETFGHHIKDYENTFLKHFFNLINLDNDLELIFIDDILNLYPPSKLIRPLDSSWSTTRNDLERNVPYPLWANPTIQLHIIQNRLQNLVYDLIKIADQEIKKVKIDNKFKEIYNYARNLIDKGEFSCKLWWSCPEHFDYNIIIDGNQFLIKAAVNIFRIIMNHNFSNIIKDKSRKIYENILMEYLFLYKEIGIHTEYRYKFGNF